MLIIVFKVNKDNLAEGTGKQNTNLHYLKQRRSRNTFVALFKCYGRDMHWALIMLIAIFDGMLRFFFFLQWNRFWYSGSLI